MTDAPQNPAEPNRAEPLNTQASPPAEGGATETTAPTAETAPLGSATSASEAAPTTEAAPATEAAPTIAAAPTSEATPAGDTAHTGEAFRPTKRPVAVGVIAALAVGALIGGVSGAGVTMWVSSSNTSTPVVGNSSPTSITVNDSTDVTQITAVAAKASPSVVTIEVSTDNAGGTGSGVVLTKDGYILTNTHVVTLDGASADGKVTVTTQDGRLLTATIVGTDPISDLAVIKADGVTDLQPAEFADSAKLNVGDTAIAIGAPLGLAGTVTNGIVSALNRSITIASSAVPDDTTTEQTPQQGETPFDFWQNTEGQTSTTPSSTISLAVIQTDAAINPGNSGGALLDNEGKVIGINVAIASAGSTSGSSQSGSIGVGFAIPSNLAQRIAEEIIETGTATHALLGASVADVTDPDVPASDVVGASIRVVTDGGAAAAAGLKVDDVITQLNGIPITGKTDLTAQVRALAAGSTATVTYVRNGKAAQVEVTLGELK